MKFLVFSVIFVLATLQGALAVVISSPTTQYEVNQPLGHGTYGTVYHVTEKTTGQVYALKEFQDSPLYCRCGRTEARLLRLLNQNGAPVPKLIESFENGDQCHLVLQFMSKNLLQYQREQSSNNHRLSLPEIRIVARNTLLALQVLHSNGYIHSDIKPENIMVDDSETFDVKVIDLGSARHVAHNQYYDLQTLHYRSPEVLLHQPYTPAIDIWSLGLMLFELATGYYPSFSFDSDTPMQQLNNIGNVFYPDQKEILRELDHLLLDENTLPKDLPFRLTQIANLLFSTQPNFVAFIPAFFESIEDTPPSNALLHLITQMLMPNPANRISAEKALKHVFLADPDN